MDAQTLERLPFDALEAMTADDIQALPPEARALRKERRFGSGRPSSVAHGLSAKERASAVVSELCTSSFFWGLLPRARGQMREAIRKAIEADRLGR